MVFLGNLSGLENQVFQILQKPEVAVIKSLQVKTHTYLN